MSEFLERVASDLCQVSADKAYDSASCYEAVLAGGAMQTLPPRFKARRRQRAEQVSVRNKVTQSDVRQFDHILRRFQVEA